MAQNSHFTGLLHIIGHDWAGRSTRVTSLTPELLVWHQSSWFMVILIWKSDTFQNIISLSVYRMTINASCPHMNASLLDPPTPASVLHMCYRWPPPPRVLDPDQNLAFQKELSESRCRWLTPQTDGEHLRAAPLFSSTGSRTCCICMERKTLFGLMFSLLFHSRRKKKWMGQCLWRERTNNVESLHVMRL